MASFRSNADTKHRLVTESVRQAEMKSQALRAEGGDILSMTSYRKRDSDDEDRDVAEPIPSGLTGATPMDATSYTQ